MGYRMVTFKEIRHHPAIKTYIQAGNDSLGAIGYTEHGFAHAHQVSEMAAKILTRFGGTERETELAHIAGYMHDIGNMINRENHALTGATLAFQILNGLDMEPAEIAAIVSAIGNHDEGTGKPVNRVAAALILADKSDVRRSRVRTPNTDQYKSDIHDRVNFAVTQSELVLSSDTDEIRLELLIDTQICPVIEYFKIFLTRMFMCQGASEFLGVHFSLVINGNVLM